MIAVLTFELVVRNNAAGRWTDGPEQIRFDLNFDVEAKVRLVTDDIELAVRELELWKGAGFAARIRKVERVSIDSGE